METYTEEELTFIVSRLIVTVKYLIRCISDDLCEVVCDYSTIEEWVKATKKCLSDVEDIIIKITDKKKANAILAQYTASSRVAQNLDDSRDSYNRNEFYVACLHRATYVLRLVAKDYIRSEVLTFRTETYGDYVFAFSDKDEKNPIMGVTFKGVAVQIGDGTMSANLLYTIISTCFPDKEIYLGDYADKFPNSNLTKEIDRLNKKLYEIDQSVGKQHIKNCKAKGVVKTRGKAMPKTYQLAY